MTRTISEETDICDISRVLASPVATAFVRIVMACRGVTEARARQLYLDYINRAQPDGAPAARD
ncbi:hypothetical protein ACQR0Z_25245 [Bradyrhizobium sp. HKCCYLS3077]|uniref:hypothetical protein n=1 Tax=Bradyrhizobium sp. HKCCYLS3077 TaxID=3420761 RepID=UPI003EBCBC70